jgi:transposase InsO family protein
LFQLSRPGYYSWLKKKDAPDKNSPILSDLKEIRKKHRAYGVKRLHQALNKKREKKKMPRVSYGRVYGICSVNGLLQKVKRPRGITQQNRADQVSEDLIRRDFTADHPNRKWLGDITEIACKNGKLYISGVFDCFDGAIVGLSMENHKRASLCSSSLKEAVRRYGKDKDLIFHSDRGSQYTSREYRQLLDGYNIRQSMGRTGNCYDNARMESFFATLKKELIYRIPVTTLTREEVKRQIFRWVECEYNRDRLYSANENSMSPLEKRATYYSQQQAA